VKIRLPRIEAVVLARYFSRPPWTVGIVKRLSSEVPAGAERPEKEM